MGTDVNPAGGRPGRPSSARDRIEDHLRQLIASGEGVTSPLPSEQKLAGQFGVSRMTARGAYERLAVSGVLVRYPARGSFVAPHVVEDLLSEGRPVFSFAETDPGLDVQMRVLAYEVRPAPASVCHEFGLPAGSRLTYLSRLRTLGGLPHSLDRIHMPEAVHRLVAAGEYEKSFVAQILPTRGIAVGKGATEIGARTADLEEAKLLRLRPGDIVLVKRNFDLDPGGRPIIMEVSLSPAARVAYRCQLDFGLVSSRP